MLLFKSSQTIYLYAIKMTSSDWIIQFNDIDTSFFSKETPIDYYIY